MPNAFAFDDREEEADDYRPRSRKSTKSRMVYVLLGLFLGFFGIHNFYAGRTMIGVVQLAFNIIMAIVSIIAGVLTGGPGLVCFVYVFLVPLWCLFEIITVTKDGQGKKFA